MRTISECGKYVLQMGNAYVGKELLATRLVDWEAICRGRYSRGES